jgi:hypothetical protein
MSNPPYVQWAEDIIGSPLPARRWITNNITGAVEAALSDSKNFTFFTERFGERLARLAKALHPDDRHHLLEKVANIGDREGWYGFFAELAAWDFFIALDVRLRVEVPAPSAQLGPASTPIDGRLSGLDDLHFHVKILGDTSKRIAESIQEDVSRVHPEVTLDFNFPLDLGHEEFAVERASLVKEILRTISSGAPQFVQRPSIALTVRIHPQRPSVTVTEHGYHPYRQAENLCHLVLSHAHELLREDRNLRVHVVHPWFNLQNSSEFGGAQGDFFRAVGRRLGFDLSASERPLSDVFSGAPPNVSIRDAAQRTSGVLFLVDYSVTGTPGRSPTIPFDASAPHGVLQGFLYANPNTLPTSDGRYSLERLVGNAGPLLKVYDDFGHDAY